MRPRLVFLSSPSGAPALTDVISGVIRSQAPGWLGVAARCDHPLLDPQVASTAPCWSLEQLPQPGGPLVDEEVSAGVQRPAGHVGRVFLVTRQPWMICWIRRRHSSRALPANRTTWKGSITATTSVRSRQISHRCEPGREDLVRAALDHVQLVCENGGLRPSRPPLQPASGDLRRRLNDLGGVLAPYVNAFAALGSVGSRSAAW